MAENGSDRLVSQDQLFYESLVRVVVPVIFSGPFIVISVIGLVLFIILTMVLIILSPVFIILSPVLVSVSIVFWICLYVTGEQPIGAGWVDEASKKIVEVKYKLDSWGMIW
ncbi:hypothetical protein L1887_27245 [Cichorium endivia]|nr:hypothetical protein L1887_27245 [Cichorium endivia]